MCVVDYYGQPLRVLLSTLGGPQVWFLPARPGWMAGTHRSLFHGTSSSIFPNNFHLGQTTHVLWWYTFGKGPSTFPLFAMVRNYMIQQANFVRFSLRVAPVTPYHNNMTNAIQGNAMHLTHATNKQTNATIKQIMQLMFPESVAICIDQKPFGNAHRSWCSNTTAQWAAHCTLYCNNYTVQCIAHL